jgi:putative ABC transport system permease protein
MFKNYCISITRNLWRNKLYSLINILGLGVGIAAIVWGFQNYRFSFSFDNFHKDQKNIFRVLTKAAGSDNLRGVCPMPLATSAKTDFSSVRESVRWDSRNLNIKATQSEPFASSANFTDPAFFDLFNFPLLQGTINLNDRSTVLITEKAEKKFFGDINPIGKTLIFYSDESYKKSLTVTGVLKDPPVNSSLQFEIITNTDNQLRQDGSIPKTDDWSWFADAVFLKISNPTEAKALNKGLQKYLPLVQSTRTDIKLSSFVLEPLSQVADQGSEITSNVLMTRPQDSATYGPLILAILILLSACLNFANTTVAQSNKRLKEIGVRKVMGSTYRQIILQQLLECAFTVLLAMGLSVLLNNLWLPTYNSMFTNMNVAANYLGDHSLLSFLGLILLGVTFLAGAYPAFYISNFNAANIFRGSVKFGGTNLFSRILLGLQIVISFITVIAGVAFSRNSAFQRDYDYGYVKANLFGLYLQNEAAYIRVRDELSKMPGIEEIAGARNNIGFSYRSIPLEAKGEKKECIYLGVGDNYLDAMKLKLVSGRPFNKTGKGDYGKSMVINEKLAFEFGWKPQEAIGQQIKMNDTTLCTIIGVLRDFTQSTLFDPIEPVAMCLIAPEKYSQIIIRAKQGLIGTVYDHTKAVWAKFYPARPFNGYYQDEIGAQASRVNESVAKIFFWFAIISVLLASTGMFALVSLTILKRTKEIAIRKVVGANTNHILQLVAKGYFWIFLLSAGIGCYAGYSLSKLLLDMIFRINSGVSTLSLVVSFICVFLITASTLGSRVWLVLKTKATDVLKAD